LWRYESLLLRYYLRLVNFLRDVIQREVRSGRLRRTGPVNERAMTAVKSASRMMAKGLHFNYRKGRHARGQQHRNTTTCTHTSISGQQRTEVVESQL